MILITDPQPEAGAIEGMDCALWRASLPRNIGTTFQVAVAYLPMMTSAGWGRLVWVSSVSGPPMAIRGEPAYAATIGWLASPAASYATGQCLVADGGNSIAEERS